MSELYDSVDYNNLRFYEYKNYKELLSAIKNNQIKLSEVQNKHNNFLKKLNEVKMGKKTDDQKK